MVNSIKFIVPFWKRASDLLIATLALVLCFPVLIFLALYIKCVSNGPVFYVQERLGLGGRPFRMIKFRTMKLTANSSSSHREYVASLMNEGASEKPDYSDRLIFGGWLIRTLSLDELPQLLNVLKGEMSLVGPRPDVLIWDDYKDPEALRRFDVLPGITGLWQVSGKNSLSFEEMIALDIKYVEKHSLWMDLFILLKTIFVVIRFENS